jgi:hypothetical protein
VLPDLPGWLLRSDCAYLVGVGLPAEEELAHLVLRCAVQMQSELLLHVQVA